MLNYSTYRWITDQKLYLTYQEQADVYHEVRSLHPKYLDSKGLVALWREELLARAVLMNKTRLQEPSQLERFKKAEDPVAAIDTYLLNVYKETCSRGYRFNKDKIEDRFTKSTIKVINGQISYELEHLRRKLRLRDSSRSSKLDGLTFPLPNPVFSIVEGDVEPWGVVH